MLVCKITGRPELLAQTTQLETVEEEISVVSFEEEKLKMNNNLI